MTRSGIEFRSPGPLTNYSTLNIFIFHPKSFIFNETSSTLILLTRLNTCLPEPHNYKSNKKIKIKVQKHLIHQNGPTKHYLNFTDSLHSF